MGYFGIFVGIFLAVCVSAMAWAERPVLVELYTSSNNCPSCPDAVEALERIRSEFSASPLQVLYFPIRDALQSDTGFLRYRLGYFEPPLPTIYFDGINRITGANNRVEAAYRENIQFQINQPRSGRIFSWKEQVADEWITRVTFSLPETVPEDSWELHVAVTQPKTLPQTGVVLSTVVQEVQPVPLESAVIEDGWITRTLNLPGSDWEFFWFVQQRDPNTNLLDEVLLSSRAVEYPVIPADLTFDGILTHEDVWIFAALWHLLDKEIDFNHDGIINQLDVLWFRGIMQDNG